MAEGKTSTGYTSWGETEIRRRNPDPWLWWLGYPGPLVVRFDSRDAETWWGEFYQAQRIKYCVRHKRDNIPMYLRTGELPPNGIKREAIALKIKNLLRR